MKILELEGSLKEIADLFNEKESANSFYTAPKSNAEIFAA